MSKLMCSVQRRCILSPTNCKSEVVFRLSHHYKYLSLSNFYVLLDMPAWAKGKTSSTIFGLFLRVALTRSSEHASLSWKTSMASRHCLSSFSEVIFVSRRRPRSEAAIRSCSEPVRSRVDSVASSSTVRAWQGWLGRELLERCYQDFLSAWWVHCEYLRIRMWSCSWLGAIDRYVAVYSIRHHALTWRRCLSVVGGRSSTAAWCDVSV